MAGITPFQFISALLLLRKVLGRHRLAWRPLLLT
jgi:hypothetical protein